MNQADHEGLLRAYPVLRELPAALLGKAMGQAEAFHVPAGRCLFADGNPAASYPLLVEGIVRVSRTSPGGHEVLLYRLVAVSLTAAPPHRFTAAIIASG